MKIVAYIGFVLLMCGCNSGTRQYQRVLINYVSLHTLTNHNVSCAKFETSFSELEFNSKEISDSENLERIQKIINNLKRVDSNQILIDTRAKIKIFLPNDQTNELCIGNTFAKLNNDLYDTSDELRALLLELPLKELKIIEE